MTEPVENSRRRNNFSPEEIAIQVMSSEAMMWLMCGGDPEWRDSHLDALRGAWDAYVSAGGKTWGQEEANEDGPPDDEWIHRAYYNQFPKREEWRRD